jgi:threonine aldolase
MIDLRSDTITAPYGEDPSVIALEEQVAQLHGQPDLPARTRVAAPRKTGAAAPAGRGLRQAGVLAAAGSYAIAHHLERLAQDHEHARILAAACGADPAAVETNIVVFPVPDAPRFATAARAQGVLVSGVAAQRFRLVTSLAVDREAVIRAAGLLGKLTGSAQPG